MREEFELHLQLETNHNIANGMSSAEARRQAVLSFGGTERYREEMRDGRPMRWLGELLQDTRYAIRMIRHEPTFSVSVIVTLALAIGATTGVFTVVRRALLEPLSYPASSELETLHTRYAGWGLSYGVLSEPEVADLAALKSTFTAVAPYGRRPVDLFNGEQAERVRGLFASAALLPVLRVVPALGRTFSTGEDRIGAPPVVILTDPMWRRLGADSAIIGRTLRLNAEPHTVIGVLPASFDLVGADVVLPLRLDPAAPGNRGGHSLMAVARRAPGITPARAASELAVLSARLRHDFPENYRPDMRWELVAQSMRNWVVGDVAGILRVLLGAVILVLLIACANIANLHLARMRRREREVALRTALGAGRGRLIRQMITEALVLSSVSALIGLLIATIGTNAVLAIAPGAIPRAGRLTLDGGMLLTAIILAFGSALVFALIPAVRSTRSGEGAWRFWGARGVSSGGWGTAGRGLMASLVTAEVALAVLVTISAGLLLRSYSRLAHVDLGFKPAGILAFDVNLPEATYKDPERVTRFYTDLVSRLKQLPGAEQAGGIRSLPVRGGTGNIDLEVEGHSVAPGQSDPSPNFQIVTPGYFEAMRIPIVSGRAPLASDDARAPIAAWVNDVAAKRLWKGENAVGKRFRFSDDSAGPWFTVVGVVGAIKTGGAASEPTWEYFLAHAQVPVVLSEGWFHRALSVVVRSTGDPAALTPAVRRTLAELDPSVAPALLETMDVVVANAVARPRLVAVLLSSFAILAAVLAMVGIAGVLSYSVSQRRREIGIRMALGARSGQVVGFIARQGLIAAGTGLVIGTIGAVLGSRVLGSLLFQVGARDVQVFAASITVLAVVACGAVALPARRAAQIEPVETLREE